MQPDQQPTNDGTPVEQAKNFAVKLFQTAEVHTETFMIDAKDEAEALAKAGEILATKELHDIEHRLEAEDVTPQPQPEEAPAPQAEPTDTATLNTPYDDPATAAGTPGVNGGNAPDTSNGGNAVPAPSGQVVETNNPAVSAPDTQAPADGQVNAA